MAVKLVFLLSFLIVQVACGQSSLTFVIDDTGSMGGEIEQVKSAAKSIMDIVLKEKSSQIKDIVLVTFNDPVSDTEYTVLRKKTRDVVELQQALDTIQVHGGHDDCVEMSLSGIKKGLQESQQGSYAFVFTDAPAKDKHLFEEVKTLCQEKQSQVIMVLTGNCDAYDRDPSWDINAEANRVYHKIAAACNGQVFRITKSEVDEVLEYVKETTKGERTVVAATIVPAGEGRDVKFNIDEQTEYAIVSTSGSDVVLSVFDQGLSGKPGTRIMWTKNVKILKLENLTPGTYTARVRGNSEVNVMVFARTDFTFLHGFSSEVKTNLKDTDTQPITGIETYLMISVQDKTHSANIQEAELQNMNDAVVRTLPLTHVQGDLYRTDKFLSPAHTFKIVIVATSKRTGTTVKRVAKTPVTPIQSVKPTVENPSSIQTETENKTVTLECRITGGYPKPTVNWYYKGHASTKYETISEKNGPIRIQNVQLSDAGLYKCVAKNVAGLAERVVTLVVNAPPRIVFVPPYSAKYNGVEGDLAMRLTCPAVGYPTPTITWKVDNQVVTKDKSKQLYVDTNALIFLHPMAVHSTVNTSHTYVCEAKNKFGEAVQPYEVDISIPATIEPPSTSLVEQMEGSSVILPCRADGSPKPSISWVFRSTDTKVEATMLEPSDNTGTLRFDRLLLGQSGEYTCVATNRGGSKNITYNLSVLAPPTIHYKNKEFRGVVDDMEIVIPCTATGYPKPEITWTIGGIHIASGSKWFDISADGSLIIKHIIKESEGFYTCAATNLFGQAQEDFSLIVDEFPKPGYISKEIQLEEGDFVTIPCNIPHKKTDRLRWFKDGRPLAASEIQLASVKESDSGTYTCHVSSVYGPGLSDSIKLVVGSKPRFTYDDNKSIIPFALGEHAVMDCTATGVPEPEVRWYHNDRAIRLNAYKYDLEMMSDSEKGRYMCVVSNRFGTMYQEFVVLAIAAPTRIDPRAPEVKCNKPNVKVAYDKPLQLMCRISGYPEPNVVWESDDKTAVFSHVESTSEYPYDYISVLNITNVKNSANYTCKAVNSVGNGAGSVSVQTNLKHFFNIKALPSGSTLVIKSMEPSMADEYICEARNSENKRKFNLKIGGIAAPTRIDPRAPEVKCNKPKVKVAYDKPLQLMCRISGYPKPNVVWESDDKTAVFFYGESTSEYPYDYISVLNITNVKNSANYTCKAVNSEGNGAGSVSVQTDVKHFFNIKAVPSAAPTRIDPRAPEVKCNKPKVKVAYDKPLQLMCRISGYPKPNVVWESDDKTAVFFYGESTSEYPYDYISVLNITNVKNSANYTCKAVNSEGNGAGSVSVQTDLKHFFNIKAVPSAAPTRIHPRAPEVKCNKPKVKVAYDKPLQLMCRISGYPKPNVVWESDDKTAVFFYGESTSEYPYDYISVLNITNVKNSANYTCKAVNSEGNGAGSVSVQTDLKHFFNIKAVPSAAPTRIDPRAPEVKCNKPKVKVAYDKPLQLMCRISGYPKPNVVWESDDKTAVFFYGESTSEYPYDYISVLNITNVKNSANYTCKAVNSEGNGAGSVSVQTDLKHFFNIKAVPSAAPTRIDPRAPEVKCNKPKVQVAYDKPLQLMCRISGYPKPNVVWESDDKTAVFFYGESTSEYPYDYISVLNITNVKNSANYTCKAVNSEGNGAGSVSVQTDLKHFFNIKAVPSECLLDVNSDFNGNLPLIQDPYSKLTNFKTSAGFMRIPKDETIKLVCPSEFNVLPANETTVTCEKDQQFVHKSSGRRYAFADLQCRDKWQPTVKKSKQLCSNGHAEISKVGLDVRGRFQEVYEVCLDKYSKNPIYTKLEMQPSMANNVAEVIPEWFNLGNPVDLDDLYDCNNQTAEISSILNKAFHRSDGCCFERRMLVNPLDVVPGVQSAAYTPLNVALHWGTCNSKNWDEVERRVRNLVTAANRPLQVYTGTAQDLLLPDAYSEQRKVILNSRGKDVPVPKFLWKVVQDSYTKASLAIIQVNVPDLKLAEAHKYILCKDVCKQAEWMTSIRWRNVNHGFTYCCSLPDFKRAFRYHDEFPNYDRMLLYVTDLLDDYYSHVSNDYFILK